MPYVSCMEILFTWIGTADYNASHSDSLDRPGPVLQALKTEKFDKVILIQNMVYNNGKGSDEKADEFLNWLRSKSSCEIELVKVQISNQLRLQKIIT